MATIIAKIIKKASQLYLRIYQNLISPYIISSCRYYPSCSSYAKEAINKFGVKGLFLTAKRLLKCNPIFIGGYDPVPKKINKIINK